MFKNKVPKYVGWSTIVFLAGCSRLVLKYGREEKKEGELGIGHW